MGFTKKRFLATCWVAEARRGKGRVRCEVTREIDEEKWGDGLCVPDSAGPLTLPAPLFIRCFTSSAQRSALGFREAAPGS